MKYVNHPVPKKDAMALVTGKPVYTDDLAPKDCLVVKLLRSPHPNAWVREIRTEAAKKVEGIHIRMCRISVLRLQDRPIRSLALMTARSWMYIYGLLGIRWRL